jgi:hypothetical protein
MTALLVLAGVLATAPASAQFPNIFGDDGPFGRNGPFGGGSGNSGPPRPPSNVPSRPDPQYIPPPDRLPPGPPPGRIQTEPLPTPPGAPARPANVPAPGAPGAAPGDASTPAALPPGQRQQPAQKPPQQPANTAPQPGDEVVVEPSPRKIPNPTAVFSGLDKITGRIISFDVAINETVRFGALEVTPRACYSRPPTEAPQTDGFIEVDELTLQGELKRIFTGWMFAASPGLNAVEHPIYDVWLTDCKGAPQPAVAEVPPAPAPTQAKPPQRPRPAGAPPQQRATQQLPPPPGTAPAPR